MYDLLKQEFLNPPDEFSPIPFWFWNDALDEQEITRQIEDFFSKGITGFVIHPRKGLPKEIPYLSDCFFHYVKHAVSEAARLNMHVVLYDEAMYPSGSAHGMVVKANPNYASKALKLLAFPADTWTSFEEFQAFLNKCCSPDEHLLAAVIGQKNDQNEILSETLKAVSVSAHSFEAFSSEKTLFLLIETYSKGTIRGVHFGEDDCEPNAPASADLLNPHAMQEFIHITYDAYYEVLKDYFGTTVIGMFTDEPDILGRNHIPDIQPWTNGFEKLLQSKDISIAKLVLLWFDAEDHSHKLLRSNYKKTVNKQLSCSYYQQLSDWCSAHHVSLTGHPAASDDIGLLKHFHIPGQDVVWRWVAPENELGIRGKDSTMGKCSSDAARHSGKRRNSNECFGCCGPKGLEWAFTADDMKWYLDWLFVRGVNLLYPHAFFYSVQGEERFGERPPDVGPNNTFWPYYQQIVRYIRRMSWLMTDSCNCTSIAILCKEDHLPWEPAEELFCHQLEFNYLEECLLENSCVLDNGWIKIQKQAYRILLVDSKEDWSHLHKQFTEFSNAGGHIIYWDQENSLSDTLRSYLEKDSSCVQAPVLFCTDTGSSRCAKDIRISHVRKQGYDFYLFTNEGETPFSGTLSLSVDKQQKNLNFSLWDPWEGTQESFSNPCKNGLCSIPLRLDRRESLILSLLPDDPCMETQKCLSLSCKEAPLVMDLSSVSWHLHTDNSDFSLDTTQLTNWTSFESMKEYSGTMIYETDFYCTHIPKGSALLDLGIVHEIASVTLNGQRIGTCLWSPYRFTLASALVIGENHLRIDVANTPANHFMKAELPSGLFGPVRLEVKS